MNTFPERPTGPDPFDARLLTDEELNDLVEREDHGITPVALEQFTDPEELQASNSNFPAYFTTRKGSIHWDIYRGSRPFQRFGVLNPDLEATLSEKLRGRHPSEFSDEDWESLYMAHQKMSQLVDAQDPGVVIDGQVDTKYLRH